MLQFEAEKGRVPGVGNAGLAAPDAVFPTCSFELIGSRHMIARQIRWRLCRLGYISPSSVYHSNRSLSHFLGAQNKRCYMPKHIGKVLDLWYLHTYTVSTYPLWKAGTACLSTTSRKNTSVMQKQTSSAAVYWLN